MPNGHPSILPRRLKVGLLAEDKEAGMTIDQFLELL
jgi:uncharacterized protein (DUF433 family)